MSKLILTAPVLALATAAAPAHAQTYEWTGFYIGAHGGLVDTDPEWEGTNIYQTVDGLEGGFTVVPHSDPISENVGGSEFAAGGRVGFNLQMGSFLLGAEADASFFDYTGAASRSQGPSGYTVVSDASDLYTVRARAGVTFGSAMLFVTGGAAFSNLEHTLLATNTSEVVVDGGEGCAASLAPKSLPGGPVGGTCGGGDTVEEFTSNLSAAASSGTGWTFGGGGELKVSENISLAGTLLYIDFGSEELADSDPPNSVAATVDTTMFVGMLGINFTF